MNNDLEDGPIWQDDSSVTNCFLCNSTYHIFNRRHHCRKCGRVVCGPCSQQRVKYFPNTIVVLDYSGAKHTAMPYDRFRTCDECVEEIRMIRRALFAFDTRRNDEEENDEEEDEVDGEGSAVGTATSSSASSVHEPIQSTSEMDGNNDDDNNSVGKHVANTRTRLLRTSSSRSSQLIPNSSRSQRQHRYHHRHSNNNRDDESDDNLCPVCAVDLLKLYIDKNKTHIENISNIDFESFKAGHISDCLIDYDFSTSNQRFSPTNKSTARNKMLVYNIPPIPKPKFENIPDSHTEGGGEVEQQEEESTSAGDEDVEPHIGSVNSTSTIPPSAEKREEDIIENECVICLEDLKPGDKVGRLECLCVFHYKCIKDWFNKKGYGECPVHFLHK
ncbi:uncharacterized protein J8A68_000118 [[Candida] subhashii]|uniref:Uncharacterized protein n=1 Tax=[Candida] subhashii TaxID=561895 RepID=A0A8J5V5Y5_9ASCO|nr:uncharacterized protein J8A68_000118 [[Candida] subhashii]KAG7666349.1 hypothetical protein J8A68_000118 [[Candida] subhashii]